MNTASPQSSKAARATCPDAAQEARDATLGLLYALPLTADNINLLCGFAKSEKLSIAALAAAGLSRVIFDAFTDENGIANLRGETGIITSTGSSWEWGEARELAADAAA